MYATTMTHPNFSKMIRNFILMALLVGSLQVTRCSNDEDEVSQALRDQHDRMHKIVLMVTGN